MLRAYKSRPSGRRGAEVVKPFFRARVRSLFASLCFRSRWKRALSPLIADMVTQAYQIPTQLAGLYRASCDKIEFVIAWLNRCAVVCRRTESDCVTRRCIKVFTP